MLSQYEDKQTVLSFVNFEKVISYVTVNGSMEDQGLVTTFVSDYIGDLSEDKIVSLLPFWFIAMNSGNSTINEENRAKIKNKMDEVKENNSLYQSVFKLRNCDFRKSGAELWEKLSDILEEMKDDDQQGKQKKTKGINSLFVHEL